jgi:hypothetical protein
VNGQVIKELPLDEDVRDILGRPNFTFIGMAQILRLGGYEIRTKAEDEQAVCIHWLLTHYFKSGSNWRVSAQEELRAINDAQDKPHDQD